MLTSNHVHLVVKDTGGDVIAQSMELIAGRTAQECNRRKNRNVKSELGSKAMQRDIEHIDGAYTLREQSEAYDGNLIGDTEPLRLENAFLWHENAGTA
jgi:hypothetical protein